MLAIPIGESILYVEPIYIQAQTAAYPELRTVVLMHGDRMSYAPTFSRALEGLVGGEQVAALDDRPSTKSSGDAERAKRAFDEYLKLMAEGRFGDAGAVLERLREQLRRLADGGPLPTR